MSSLQNKNDVDFTTDSIVIDPDVIRNVHVLRQIWHEGNFENVFDTSGYWTKIKVRGGKNMDKDVVLKAILMAVYPINVIPALYQIDGEDSFFLVRNCSKFIWKLALSPSVIPLAVPHPSGKYFLYLSISTLYLSTSIERLNPLLNVKASLNKRMNVKEKTVDLTNFSQDEGLGDIYFPLSVPQFMTLVLDSIQVIRDCKVILQHNNLTSIEPLNHATFISELDLSHNNLTWEGFVKFTPKRGMKLSKLWLDGNPLCVNISESDYIKKIDAVIPYVQKLDGVDVSNISFGHATLRNYVIDGSWADFIDHFLHHYFGLMESPNRHHLARLYHQKASFTFCAYSNPNDKGAWRKISNYMTHSRNLLTLSDVNRAYTTSKVGPQQIVDILNKFPAIQFDPNSFTVDVPFSQMEKMIVINVGGIFKEADSGLFYFHRTFVLTPFKSNDGEWKIENDMLSLTVATEEQIEKSFTKVRQALHPKTMLILNPATKDRDSLIPEVCEVTKLTKEWAIRFLEQGSWDLERTLQAFTDQLKINQIPMRAFSI